MNRADRKAQFARILAVLLCVTVAVFFSALLVHSHGVGAAGDHDAHCPVCALGHSAASPVTAISIIIALQMLMLLRVGTPSRGSPRFTPVPTTRPPPFSL